MASLLLALHSLGHASLSFAEQAVLREKNYRLSKGKIDEVDTFPSMLDRFAAQLPAVLRASPALSIDVRLSRSPMGLFLQGAQEQARHHSPRGTKPHVRLSPQALSDLSEAIAWYARPNERASFGHLPPDRRLRCTPNPSLQRTSPGHSPG